MRKTKKSLLMSVVSLLLCFTMLLGTTYAWFTDSVSSGSNVIKSGNLDLDVQYTLDGKTWNDLDGANDLFQKGLWEPGHTEVVALKITNKGSLALKYAANMNILNEKIGTNKDGEDIVLSDILTVSTLTQAANDVGDICLYLAYMGENGVAYENVASFKDANILKADQELFVGDAHYIFIKVDMPETVGNEANHDGVNIPTIEFGVNVLATQYAYENDSFGDQYDAGAEYAEYDEGLITDAAALKAALEAGEDVKLGADITMTDVNRSFVTMDNVGEVTLDLNGYTLSAVSHGRNDTALIITNGTTFTVTGNGKFIYGTAFATLGADSKLIIENGSIDADDTVTCATGNYAIICQKNSTVEIEGGTIDIVLKCTDGCNWIGELTNKIGSVNINGGIFVGIAPPAASVADGATVTSEVVNGSTVYTVTSAN